MGKSAMWETNTSAAIGLRNPPKATPLGYVVLPFQGGCTMWEITHTQSAASRCHWAKEDCPFRAIPIRVPYTQGVAIATRRCHWAKEGCPFRATYIRVPYTQGAASRCRWAKESAGLSARISTHRKPTFPHNRQPARKQPPTTPHGRTHPHFPGHEHNTTAHPALTQTWTTTTKHLI